MTSPREGSTTSDDSFITPVSSTADLLVLSPRRYKDGLNDRDMTEDLLTGTEFDSICDVTMQEITNNDEIFRDPSTIDFLIKCTDSNRNIPGIDRGKESLFVKFDPLFSRGNDDFERKDLPSSNSAELDIGYETGSTNSVSGSMAMPKRAVSVGSSLINSNKEKPTQKVPPAVKDTSCTDTRVAPLVRSVSDIMTPARVPIERLVNYTSFTPPQQDMSRNSHYEHYYNQIPDHVQSLKMIVQRQEQDILDLRQENRDLKYSRQEMEKSIIRQKEDMEMKIKKLTSDNANLIERENVLNQQVREKALSNKQMSVVIEEYEKTISSLIGEREKDNLEFQAVQEALQKERDQAMEHLSNMEGSFNDLLTKYERCKTVILEFKERERNYEEKLKEYQQGIDKFEELYSKLKEVTSESLAKANETLDNEQKAHYTEITKLNATIKKQEVMISSLQESLAQKDRDNHELTAICDELINKVG
ncbi:Transforming acidic coiled-coil-containing protein 1 [Eumeta japonica]|uniref:Transforming acidic coiled-coil-containing protein 1 n=1 Tax=Eumeta variegata TaxID=151549 RepID=A0A4C1W9V2_EUMVA|nr:Transforming acidic coiled-coil-containing protein 1 [Eumeta japonica]